MLDETDYRRPKPTEMTEADGADGAKDTPPTAAAVVWVGGRRLMKLMKLIELTKLTKAGRDTEADRADQGDGTDGGTGASPIHPGANTVLADCFDSFCEPRSRPRDGSAKAERNVGLVSRTSTISRIGRTGARLQ